MKMSRIESAIRIVLEFTEAYSRHDVAGMMPLLSDDCVFENADGAVYPGKAAITQFCRDFFRQTPQANIEVEDIFGLGLRCVMRWNFTWEDTAGKKRHVRGVDIFQVKNGLSCERLTYVKENVVSF